MPKLILWLRTILSSLLLLVLPAALFAQATTITIDEAYQLARKNYPLIKQRELIKKSSAYSVENASKGYLPQLNFSGQAT